MGGWMIGEGYTRAYSCLAKGLSKHILTYSNTFLLSANLALICGLFSPFPPTPPAVGWLVVFLNQKTEPSTQCAELPSLQQTGSFWRPGRHHLGQHSHFCTCGRHPLHGAACCVCIVLQWAPPLSLTAPFSLDKTLGNICKPFQQQRYGEPQVLHVLHALYLPSSCTTPVLLPQWSAFELLQRPACCHHMLSVL